MIFKFMKKLFMKLSYKKKRVKILKITILLDSCQNSKENKELWKKT